MQKKEYAAVDLFKMVCAILVMMIHTKPFENIFWIDAGIGMVTRFAVPFFFTVSGYFLFKKVGEKPEEKWQIVGGYLLRLLRFYTIWFVIFRIVGIALEGNYYGIGFNLKQFFFTTNGSPLWFVNALLWAVIIVAVLSTWLGRKIVFVVGVIFLLIGYCMSTLLGITGEWAIVQALKPITGFLGIQGGLFFAFPYVAMGAVLAEKYLVVENKKNILGIACFFICLGVESLVAVLKLNAPFTFLWISALPMTWFVVKLMLTIELDSKPVYYAIRKVSTLFYVLHVVVFKVLQKGINVLDLADCMNLLLTFGTMIITFVLAHAIVKLSNKSWLRFAM